MLNTIDYGVTKGTFSL